MSTNVVITVENNSDCTLDIIGSSVHVNWFHNPARQDVLELGTVQPNSTVSTPTMQAYGSDSSVISIPFSVTPPNYPPLATQVCFNVVQAGNATMNVVTCPSNLQWTTAVEHTESGLTVFKLILENNATV